MKKTLIFLIFSTLFINSFAQERLTFYKVINVDSTLTKSDIYNGVKDWFGMNFVSAKNVLEIDDKDAGLIIANTNVDYSRGGLTYLCYSGTLRYTIKVQIRDGRFRVEVTNFFHTVNPGNGEGCALGLILTTGSGKKNIQKSFSDKVWADITAKAKVIADRAFSKFEQIKFSSITDNENNDW